MWCRNYSEGGYGRRPRPYMPDWKFVGPDAISKMNNRNGVVLWRRICCRTGNVVLFSCVTECMVDQEEEEDEDKCEQKKSGNS
mmetsp:Transcript_65549/g.73148  ORF Transcript_65549/g.73148 Transcript_65549/m.73148 type:complete len:83 (-) Transcript_65549:28-276(-)